MNRGLRTKFVSLFLIILVITNAALAAFAYRTTKQLQLQKDKLIADYIDSLHLAFGRVDDSIKWMYYSVGENEPEPQSMYELTVYLLEIQNTLDVGQRCVDYPSTAVEGWKAVGA